MITNDTGGIRELTVIVLNDYICNSVGQFSWSSENKAAQLTHAFCIHVSNEGCSGEVFYDIKVFHLFLAS